MTTPNLAIAHIAASQNQKEVTANAAFDALDEALTGLLSVALSNADYTLSSAQALENMVFEFTGALTANRNIVVPTNKKLYVVLNSTTGGYSLTVKTATGTGIAVKSTASFLLLYCDGTNVVRLASDANILRGVAVDSTTPTDKELLAYDSGSTSWKPSINGYRVSSLSYSSPAPPALSAAYGRQLIECDASGGAFDVTLPDATLCAGAVVIVKKTDSSGNAVTVTPAGSPVQTIDGAASYALSAQWKYVSLISDGTNWLVIGSN